MSITSTYFNLALWVPRGKAWEVLAGGFTRVLKGLLAKQIKGDAYYKIEAPAVHILTFTPGLDVYARKARFSLLISVCWTAPVLPRISARTSLCSWRFGVSTSVPAGPSRRLTTSPVHGPAACAARQCARRRR